ncbi:MAG: superoxide dismutase [Candidatus Binatia bacterium]
MVSRRDTLKALCGGVAAAALHGGQAMADTGTPGGSAISESPRAYRGAYEARPLPFDPAKLKGLSETLLTSHHQNNYGGAVKRLNLIQQQLGGMPKDAAPYQIGALKREELIATNSMILHELYFGNLGGDGKPSGPIVPLLGAAYGSLAAWEQELRLTGASLGGGSGWVIVSYDPHARAVHTAWAGDHTQNLAGGTPLLVMDMYEHAYAIDYGANAKAYIDAFFLNLDWDAVNQRTERARAAAA